MMKTVLFDLLNYLDKAGLLAAAFLMIQWMICEIRRGADDPKTKKAFRLFGKMAFVYLGIGIFKNLLSLVWLLLER